IRLLTGLRFFLERVLLLQVLRLFFVLLLRFLRGFLPHLQLLKLLLALLFVHAMKFLTAWRGTLVELRVLCVESRWLGKNLRPHLDVLMRERRLAASHDHFAGRAADDGFTRVHLVIRAGLVLLLFAGRRR